MAHYKHLNRKLRLARLGRQTKWPPFWLIEKIFQRRKLHPVRITRVKRSWRRSKTKA